MNRNERLLEVAKHYNLRDAHFATRIGATKQLFYLWKSFKQDVPDKYLISIVEQFPEINARWVITGEGEILLPTLPPTDNLNNHQYIEELLHSKDVIISAKDEIIGFLKKSIQEQFTTHPSTHLSVK